ncbi:M23 family metallopeptidase [Streptomyces sp. NPDC001941]|uniref:murein hydrolase activator EnvC family protein n=1 Tax=Streptomyces sp. NPDC001941 TaxID=3154659 RepID=UPI00331727CE
MTRPLTAALPLTLIPALVWPLGPPDPVVVRGWEPPATPYGPGHRGIDLAAPQGALVRAVAWGTVTFAGRVAGRGVLTITLPHTGNPPLTTTYEPVTALVPRGTHVTRGRPVATLTGTTHCGTGCLHWGLRRGTGTYENPLTHLRRPPSRLLPRAGVRGP